MSDAKVYSQISPGKLRIGTVLFCLWWLPVYLLVPGLTRALGEQGNAHAVKLITLSVIIIQSVFGIAGVLLLGKEFSLVIKKIKLKRLAPTLWHGLWSGKVNIDPSDLRSTQKN